LYSLFSVNELALIISALGPNVKIINHANKIYRRIIQAILFPDLFSE